MSIFLSPLRTLLKLMFVGPGLPNRKCSMPSVLSRGYFHTRLSERWMLVCLPKSSYTRVSAMSLPRNTPTQSGIQRRVMSIRLYPPSQFLSSHRPICAGHQSLHLPVLRPRGDEFVTVTRLEHIIRPLCSFRLHSPLICVVSKRGHPSHPQRVPR
jgi:hypothetical protein